MRMARVNVTMPDDLYAQARQQGLNISRLAQQAVTAELTRRSKIAQLDEYLAQLEAQFGPVSDAEQAEASAWADRVLAPARNRRSA